MAFWTQPLAADSVPAVPKIRAEDREFALRLGGVLRELRAKTGWTQEQAAERANLPTAKLGRWERGDYAPKGYDLGRLFRFYEEHGAKWEWFFDPPEIVVVNPVRTQLNGSGSAAENAADSAEARAVARRQRAAERRVVAPGTPRRRTPPGSPR